MIIEYPTENGSVYVNDDEKWYRSRKGRKIPLEKALRISHSELEEVLIDYDLEKGDVVPSDKIGSLFDELKEENNELGEDYRICFLYKQGNDFKLGYSSKLIGGDGSSFGDLELGDEKEFKIDA